MKYFDVTRESDNSGFNRVDRIVGSVVTEKTTHVRFTYYKLGGTKRVRTEQVPLAKCSNESPQRHLRETYERLIADNWKEYVSSDALGSPGRYETQKSGSATESRSLSKGGMPDWF